MSEPPPIVEFRSAEPDDDEFFFEVFRSVREEEFEPLGLSANDLEAFLRSQAHAQKTHYERVFPQAERSIILSQNRPAGILVVNDGEDLRLVDLALLPDFRRLGIGSSILRDLQARAAQLQKPLVLHVERHSPAKALYARLGFQAVGEVGIYLRMHWLPPA